MHETTNEGKRTQQKLGHSVRRIEYYSTPDEIVERYAHEVCTTLAIQDDAYTHPEIKHGFATFLKVVSRALANSLNRKQLVRRAPNGTPKSC